MHAPTPPPPSQEARPTALPVRNSVFILMNMDPQDDSLTDTCNAIKAECDSFDLTAIRIDDVEHQDRITDRIWNRSQPQSSSSRTSRTRNPTYTMRWDMPTHSGNVLFCLDGVERDCTLISWCTTSQSIGISPNYEQYSASDSRPYWAGPRAATRVMQPNTRFETDRKKALRAFARRSSFSLSL